MDNSNYIRSSPYYSYQGTTHIFYLEQPGVYNIHNIMRVAHPVNPTHYSWEFHLNRSYPSQQNLNNCSTPNVHSTTGILSTIYSPIETPRGSYGHQNHEQSPIIAGAHHIISQSSPSPSGDKSDTSRGSFSKIFDSTSTSVFDIPELPDYSMLESQSSSTSSNISSSAPAFINNPAILNYSCSTNVSNSLPANNSFISNTSSTDVCTSVFSSSSNGSTSSSSAISANYTVS